ncbi:MAG: PAS domain S-box protein [Candidatus Hodarchaeales archaeon]|jgi:PAS domain S-box-containing protein
MSRVLLVDDDENLLNISKEFLTREEPTFELVTATSARNALQRLKENSFDVVVADYQMPGMDGLELLETLRTRGSTIPFIMFTGRGREEIAMQALNLGADYYLMKGGNPESMYGELAHIITRVIEHRQTEVALRESEERFRVTYENAAIGIAIVDLKGRIREINPALQGMLGYSREELSQMTIMDLIHSDDLPMDLNYFQELIAGSRDHYQLEERLIRKDGHVFWVHLIATLVRDESGHPHFAIGMVEDITERKQAETNLKNREKQLLEAQRLAQFGSWEWNIRQNTTVWSEELYRIFGVAPSYFDPNAYEGFLNCIHPEDREAVAGVMEKALSDLASFSIDYRIVPPEGTVRFILARGKVICDKAGQPVKMVGTSQDITARKQAERALRESEAKYRQLIESLQEGIWVIDADAHTTFVNNRIAELLGYTTEEMRGRHLFSFMDEQVVAIAKHYLERRHHGIEEQHEFEFLRKDGTRVHTLMATSPLTDEAGNYTGAIAGVLDITERKGAEEKVRESEHRFRTIFSKANDAIFVIRLDAGGPLGQFIEVNDIACVRYGYSRAEFLQMGPQDLNAPEVFEQHLQTGLPERAQQDQPITLETLHIAKDGTRIPVEINSHLIALANEHVRLAVVRDISERKQAEKQLQESEHNYRLMVEHSLQGVVILQEMRIVYANPAFEEMTGYTLKELQTLSPQDLMAHVHPDDQDIIWTDFRERMAGKPGPSRYEFRFFRKNRTLCWAEAFPTRIDYQGKPAAQGVCIDITERKQTEEHLAQQKTELSEFAHAMAHDLRNGLLNVEGYADLLRREANLAYAEKIGQLAQRMNTLLARSVSLADAGLVIDKTAKVNLTDLLQEVAETTIPENLTFAQDRLPTVVGDREKLSQVFQNLFENAVIHGQPRKIEVRRHASVEGTTLLVTNDGAPISREDRSQIFQRGFTTKEEGGGLGLAIVEKLVKAHGWEISLDESPETTFRIFIPTSRKS